ncbi:MAG: IPT/TIG domain-containing protein [Candidatus Nomurabacteria bacterium]|nr:IPT/TIG domain-containing protein [Candidatus Nomurabacteria bacterium]
MLAMTIGLAGAISLTAQAASSVVEVQVTANTIQFDVDTPQNGNSGGNAYDLVFTGQNVSTVDIYLDGGTTPLTTITVNESGSFGPQNYGQLVLPQDVTLGGHNLHFVAHAKDGSLSDVTVDRAITVALSAPRITSVSPNPVPTAGNVIVKINGENLDGATEVLIDGSPCAKPFTQISPTQIECLVPAHKVGKVSVTVTTPNGTYTFAANFRGALIYADGFIPGVPSTGLFMFGDRVVTNYDLMLFAVLLLIIGVVILLINCGAKNSPRRVARKSGRVAKTAAKPRAAKRPVKTRARK